MGNGKLLPYDLHELKHRPLFTHLGMGFLGPTVYPLRLAEICHDVLRVSNWENNNSFYGRITVFLRLHCPRESGYINTTTPCTGARARCCTDQFKVIVRGLGTVGQLLRQHTMMHRSRLGCHTFARNRYESGTGHLIRYSDLHSTVNFETGFPSNTLSYFSR